MYTTIKSELKNFSSKCFTGHIRFGVEKGQVVSENISTKREQFADCSGKDFDNELLKISAPTFCGSVEYDFDFGHIVAVAWSATVKGDELKERIRVNKCRNVRIVAKK